MRRCIRIATDTIIDVRPVLGVLVFSPRSWIILDNLEFLCQDLGFFRFLAKILAVNLVKKSKKNQDLAKKSKIMPVKFREENYSHFYNYQLVINIFLAM